MIPQPWSSQKRQGGRLPKSAGGPLWPGHRDLCQTEAELQATSEICVTPPSLPPPLPLPPPVSLLPKRTQMPDPPKKNTHAHKFQRPPLPLPKRTQMPDPPPESWTEGSQRASLEGSAHGRSRASPHLRPVFGTRGFGEGVTVP